MNAPFADLALLPRAIVIGSVTAETIGSTAGLVIGLFVYAPTAPVAALELGLTATITGALTASSSDHSSWPPNESSAGRPPEKAHPVAIRIR